MNSRTKLNSLTHVWRDDHSRHISNQDQPSRSSLGLQKSLKTCGGPCSYFIWRFSWWDWLCWKCRVNEWM